MAKPKTAFVCQSCGNVTPRWQGRCEACGAWNSIIEDGGAAGIGAQAARGARKGRIFALGALAQADRPQQRLETGIGELDRVTGGGFVPGSVLLLGGEPGIGKSTLLIQACAALAQRGERVVYISGEEAMDQVRLRAGRLGLATAPVELAAETGVEDIVATLSNGPRPALVVIDSIQTMWTDGVESSPGTVTQVRGSAQALIRFAKTTGAIVILVGHVTKDGQIAGPRVVEHMVDAVISFEGEGGRDFRILRAVKNRFGPTDEIGVFEMTGGGLSEVANPSALFLTSHEDATPGVAVFAGMEGTRPLLVEIQALVAPTSLGTPRRAVVGWDTSRLAMVVAVLEAHAGLKLGQHDIYLTIAGGLRVSEPAADLAAAAALVSSLSGQSLSPRAVYFGEVGLSGAVRPVAHAAARLKEAAKLGFTHAVAPRGADATSDAGGTAMTASACEHIGALVADIARPKDKTSDRSAEKAICQKLIRRHTVGLAWRFRLGGSGLAKQDGRARGAARDRRRRHRTKASYGRPANDVTPPPCLVISAQKSTDDVLGVVCPTDRRRDSIFRRGRPAFFRIGWRSNFRDEAQFCHAGDAKRLLFRKLAPSAARNVYRSFWIARSLRLKARTMPSYLDLGLIVIILISALLAMLRGFTREVLAIASWGAAAAAAVYFYPLVLPYVKPYIQKDVVAMAASAAAVFFVTLILVSIVTIKLSDAILDSKVGALDRSLGFVFGAARGLLLCVIAFVFFSWLVPADKQPEWVKSAKMRPLLQSTGDQLTSLLPDDPEGIIGRFKKEKTATPVDEPPPEGDSGSKAIPTPPSRGDSGKEP